MINKVEDIYIGKKYGQLTILKFYKMTKQGHRVYLCSCDCGNEKAIRISSLKNGNTKSCGCLKLLNKVPENIRDTVKVEEIISNEYYIGKKYNKLTVQEYFGRDIYNYQVYKCKCDCGNTTTVRLNSIASGLTKSCGCIKRNDDVIVGHRFGKLTAVKFDSIIKTGQHAAYLCKCDCGNEKVVKGASLRNGNTKSCGCIRRGKKPKE